jgi:hypothetical protein
MSDEEIKKYQCVVFMASIGLVQAASDSSGPLDFEKGRMLIVNGGEP